MRLVRAKAVVVVLGVSSLVACSIAEIPGTGAAPQVQTDVPSGCEAAGAKLEKLDLATLNACTCSAGGKAHCVAKTQMPASLSKQLADCDGTSGACVPDSILASGGELAPCKTSGVDGRCVSLCVPKVATYAEALTRGDGETCAADERCVPCTTPDGSSSGVCEIGRPPPSGCAGSPDAGGAAAPGEPGAVSCPFTGTELDVSQMPVCAPGGRCVSQAFLEAAMVDPKTRSEIFARLASCATGLCVPEEYLRKYGQHKPKACSSFAGIEGRCLSTVFKDVGAQKDLLQRDTCTENERCVPCFNPANGAPTGACSTVSCDAATKAPPTLAECCRKGGQMRGKCVPKKDVPTQLQERLSEHECDGATELCVPTENLDVSAVPQTCSASSDKGVCVSDCVELSFFEGLFVAQGTCPDAKRCVPCINPTTMQPTGVPGCL
jgi:hypothetical protein